MGCPFVAIIDAFENGASGFYIDGRRMEKRRYDGRLPRKHQGLANNCLVSAAEGRSPPHEYQQIVAEYGWRKHQRKCHERIEQIFAAEILVRKKVRNERADAEDEQCSQSGDPQAQPEGEPVYGEQGGHLGR